MVYFDKTMNNSLAQKVKNRLTFKVWMISIKHISISFCHLKTKIFGFLQAGKLNTYRFCDNVWTFLLSDVEFRDVQELAKGETVKIVACDGKGTIINLLTFCECCFLIFFCS